MPKSSTPSIAEASTKIFQVLEPFESEDRVRIVRGTLLLLGEQAGVANNEQNSEAAKNMSSQPNPKDALAFFALKQPSQKTEEFATAARYQELHENGGAV